MNITGTDIPGKDISAGNRKGTGRNEAEKGGQSVYPGGHLFLPGGGFPVFGGMIGNGVVYLSVGTVFLALGAGEGRKKGPPSGEKDEKEGETPKDEKQNLGE